MSWNIMVVLAKLDSLSGKANQGPQYHYICAASRNGPSYSQKTLDRSPRQPFKLISRACGLGGIYWFVAPIVRLRRPFTLTLPPAMFSTSTSPPISPNHPIIQGDDYSCESLSTCSRAHPPPAQTSRVQPSTADSHSNTSRSHPSLLHPARPPRNPASHRRSSIQFDRRRSDFGG